MKKQLGLWLDHKKAIFVDYSNNEEVETIESEVEPKTKEAGGARARQPYAPQTVSEESHTDERYRHELKKYYDGVIKKLSEADQIYIFGPGPAKKELKNSLQKMREFKDKDLEVSSADYITLPQIREKVRNYFADHK
jgi:hypothetical protein